MTLAPAFSKFATANGTSVTATFDGSHTATAGSFLLAAHFVRNSGALTDPSGWTLVATATSNSEKRMSVWAKSAAGTETGIAGPTTASTRQTIYVYEFLAADVDTASLMADLAQLATTFGNSGSSTVTTTSTFAPSINPASTTECWFLSLSGTQGGETGSHTASNSFSLGLTDSPTGASFTSTRNITDPGSTSTTHTWATAQKAMQALLAVPAKSSSTPPPRGYPRGLTRGVKK